jgi:carbonic anhydrase/acetyltransferase-like protein (isoleucine patch superfamily)
MTTIMENGMVAQNTCLQMCVVGRNTFIGAGTTFTDYNLLPAPIMALDGRKNLSESNRPVLGGCVGHNCRLGAGLVISPARVIESDVVLVARDDRQIISKNIAFKDSDHHTMRASQLHKPLYRPDREEQREIETW